MQLSEYPQTTVVRYIASACKRYGEGDLTAENFKHFCFAAIEDGRDMVVRELTLRLPIPEQTPDEDARAMENLLSILPGIRHVYTEHQLPKTEEGRRLMAQREALQNKNDAVAQLANGWEICNKHWPWWTAVLQHADSSVRLTAVSRLPTTGPLALLLPWMVTDSSSVVRATARQKLGIVLKVRPTTWRDYRKGLVAINVALEEIRNTTHPERAKTYLGDPRPRVRFAAAVMLQDGDLAWTVLAADPSPRLRKLAAERVKTGSAELRALCTDENAGVAAVALRRAWQAYDAGSQGTWKPPAGRPIRADRAARKAWKARLEAYFNE